VSYPNTRKESELQRAERKRKYLVMKEEHFIDKYFIMALYFHSASFKQYVAIETSIRLGEKVTDTERGKMRAQMLSGTPQEKCRSENNGIEMEAAGWGNYEAATLNRKIDR
jgi:hypothetical protein